ncbi:caspase family protein [Bradyrhizobium sp. AUGA SZCCT0222]|uniref:caspase family protein n=1 Tax=Bradyrhizobium sp. AUGA SZCCT0222 TaxID=2807668 RepID=UPI001BADC2EF|nr:caspase family protein [Bradyrhizobium sp. AUGA SZCCT0222]MBR1270536.1 caspase family protein [Bradyrhizobium sp. AUGA SZCCT0222]
MGIVTSKADREIGVVYRDDGLQAVPATHALVIGVGQYASKSLSPVSSPPASARLVTEWFLDGTRAETPGGFDNPAKPLGSLSVLLSELPEGARSQVAGADVPRATFENVQKAVWDWIDRAGSNPDNFLFLFVSSHGESFGRRTAFLLEDYGTNKRNATAGMSEVEQFVEALANVDANEQLLIFDCCRTPTPLALGFDKEFGTKLIEPVASGGRKRAHVLRSTGLGGEAYGLKQGTIFANVLLDALRGLAAASNENWIIDNYVLARTVARLLELHVRDGQPLQQPDMQLNAPFVVSAVPPTNVASVFVSLAPGHKFSTSRFQVMDGTTVLQEVAGTSGIESFVRLQLPQYQVRKIVAFDANDAIIGETRIEPVPPVAFRQLPEQVRVSRAPVAKGIGKDSRKGKVVFSIAAAAGTPVPKRLVAVIRPRGVQAAKPLMIAVPASPDEAAVEIEPGWYDISLGVSDSQTLSSEVQVKAGATATVMLQLPVPVPGTPPRMAPAMAKAAGPARRGAKAALEISEADLRARLTQLGASEKQIVGNGSPVADVFAAPIPLSFAQVLAADRGIAAGGATAPAPVQLKAETSNVFAIQDSVSRRLPDRDRAPAVPTPDDQPVWVAAIGRDWHEIAAIPSLGAQGKFQNDPAGKRDSWTPVLVVEPDPKASGSHLAVVVDTRQWAGLLAFLAQRDFELSAIALRDILANNSAKTALVLKVKNPLAATAGALVAVATNQLDQLKIPEAWLRNLANWFPQLPDGPVILARHLMSQGGKDVAKRAEAKALLLDAYRRGVPVFSLSIDWLAQGLADFAGDPDVATPAKTMWRFAQLCDPARAFTVLRIPVQPRSAP